MPENDLQSRLAQLAEHGHRTGRLAAAAAVRARADRRRRRRYAGTGTLGVVVVAALGAGIAAAQPRTGLAPAAPSGLASPSVAASIASVEPSVPSGSAATPPAAKPGSEPPGLAGPPLPEDTPSPLSGERQVFVFVLDRGQELPEAVLAVTKQQRVEVTVDYGERALFVPDPVAPDSDRYVIKTGKIRSGGEAFCWSVRANESTPSTIVTAACDYGDARQIFTVTEAGEDNQERMTYVIRNGDQHLTFDPVGEHGLIARDLGDTPPDTTYVFVDRGASTVPELGG